MACCLGRPRAAAGRPPPASLQSCYRRQLRHRKSALRGNAGTTLARAGAGTRLALDPAYDPCFEGCCAQGAACPREGILPPDLDPASLAPRASARFVDTGPATRSVMPERHPAARYLRPLPEKPDLEKQRKLAKALVRDMVRGDAEARARVQALHPDPPAARAFTLSRRAARDRARLWLSPAGPAQAQDRGADQDPARSVRRLRCAPGDGRDACARCWSEHPELKDAINEPLFDFGRRAAQIAARNLPLLDLLLAHGADINARSRGSMAASACWRMRDAGAGGCRCWRAARASMCGPQRISAGCRSCARCSMPILPWSMPRAVTASGRSTSPRRRGRRAACASAAPRSTPSTTITTRRRPSIWSGDRPAVCRFLVARGARTDLLMACALGDVAFAKKHLDADPASIRMRVSPAGFR